MRQVLTLLLDRFPSSSSPLRYPLGEVDRRIFPTMQQRLCRLPTNGSVPVATMTSSMATMQNFARRLESANASCVEEEGQESAQRQPQQVQRPSLLQRTVNREVMKTMTMRLAMAPSALMQATLALERHAASERVPGERDAN